MKRQVIHYSLFVISLCATAHGQIAQRWISEASRPTAQEITIYRGETLALEPTITVHGTPYAWPDETEVTLWWQSSNMGASWWSTPAALGTATGALRAVWSPACDSGADRYTFFIRASAPSGIAYRASGTLIMRHSPGAVPNALPLPTPAIDFASIEIHNAPWLFESDWQSGSNALAGAVQALGPRLDSIETEAADWRAAFAWGPHFAAGYLLSADLAPYATTAALAVHTNRTDNPHGVTAPQIGALTNELDLAALRAYHYGSPDIVESPAEWFVFDAGTITAFNWAEGRKNVVIPWAIGGVPVTVIGTEAFQGSGIVSVIAPKTVTVIGDDAFYYCYSLASVSLPQATAIGDYAFRYCYLLASVSLPQAQTIGDYAFGSCDSLASVVIPQAQTVGAYAFAYCDTLTSVHMGQNAPPEAIDVFEYITSPPTVYVTNPQATGWGDTWSGAPVVRPPLYADAVYQEGELVATTGHVAQAIAAIPEPDLSDRPTFAQIAASNALPYTAWTGTVTPQNGTATVAYAHGNMPVLVVPNGGGTTYVTVATGTYAATSGVSRVSLSIWAGTNTIELVTNEVDYVSAPDIPTNGWGTILFRRVSDGRWKGVGL